MLVEGKPATIQPIYANDFQGEWVNYELGTRTERKFVKHDTQFWRPGGRAIVLGNGLSRQRFSINQFNRSNTNKRLNNYNVIYGCNKAYTEEGELDFLVLTHRFLDKHMPQHFYKITYSTPEVQRTRKDMNLIPVYHRMDAGATAAMLAAFHGAKEVFLFGFDGQDVPNRNNNIYAGTEYYSSTDENVQDSAWHANMFKIVSAYSNTTFYRIDTNPRSSRALTALPNYRIITFNQFVILADL